MEAATVRRDHVRRFRDGGVFSLAPFKIIFYVAACLAGGFYPAEEVWERLQKRTIDVHFLMLFVAAGAASIGAWGEGATLLFFFSFSGALEHYALGRTQKEIRSLFRDAPKTATALDELGREREVKVEQLKTGMRLLIKPGAQFPVDAEIAKGNTAADESNLTGEATPVEKKIGDNALAGTINLWGAVEVSSPGPPPRVRCKKSSRSSRKHSSKKRPRRCSPTSSAPFTPMALSACRSGCFSCGGSDSGWRLSIHGRIDTAHFTGR